MKQTTIHRRWTAVLAATAIVVTTFAAAPSASADPVSVAPGGSVTVRTGCLEPVVRPVIPVQAGTASYDAGAGILTFTAAANFGGLATVTLQCFGDSFPSWRFLVGETGAAGVDATFTPRAAPGPCILIASGAAVEFGDVVVGEKKTSATRTTVRSCASIPTRLGIAVDDATSGADPSVTPLQPTDQTPIPANKFTYEIDVGFLQTLANGAVFMPSPIASGASLNVGHALTVGVGSAGLGQQFSTKVTFTATAA